MGRFNDEIPNINLLDTKTPTIHGHTKIELYNPTTKIKNVVESDNTFQSQVAQRLMASQGGLQLRYSDTDADSLGKIVPIIFGGMMMFRDTIPVGTKYMPKTNKMIGLGYIDKSNSTYPMSLGSYNSVESSASINGMTMVYDFATNQANGQIGCVCLTHKWGAVCGGYGYPDMDRPADGVSMFATHDNSTRALDSDVAPYNDNIALVGNISYGFTWNSTAKTITVGKKHHWIEQFSLKSGYQEFRTFDVSDEIASVSGIDITTSNRNVCNYVGNNKIVVDCVYHDTYDWANGTKTYYFEYDIANDTMTLKSVTNSTGRTLYRPSGSKFGGQNVVASYSRSGDYNWYLIDRETGVVLRTIENDSSSYSIDEINCFLDRNIIYHNIPMLTGGRSGWGAWFYDKDTDTMLPTAVVNTSYNDGHFSITEDVIGKREYQTNWYCDTNPLMLLTINNLNSPVTKTAAQTMKVTYTLTES